MACDLLVRVTELSGKEFEVTMNREDTIVMLRQKVSKLMHLALWQLKLLHGPTLLKEGILKELVEPESTLDVMAIQMAANPEISRRSRILAKAFKHPFRKQLDDEGRFRVNLQIIEGETPAICCGEVDFNFQGDNLLELAISNFPTFNVDEYVNLLLSAGASVNERSVDRYTPLLSACARGFGKIAETLLNHGADPQATHCSTDALGSALKFFEACVDFGSCERTEDFQLAKFCCHLRDLKIQRILPTLTPLAQARLRLSKVATEMALLAFPGFKLSKAKVLQKIDLSEKEVEDFGSDLWVGWPVAFLTFADTIDPSCRRFDHYFVHARARVLTYYVHEELNKPRIQPKESRIDDTSSEYTDYTSYYGCDCEACRPWLYQYFGALDSEPWVSHYQAYKNRSPKYNSERQSGRRNDRPTRRVPVPSRSKGTSYSARMAKKMPSAYRGFHVEQALQGNHRSRKGGKAQLLKEELDFDRY